jgi:hypothetical protein
MAGYTQQFGLIRNDNDNNTHTNNNNNNNNNNNIPLIGVRMCATLQDFSVNVIVEQHFRNDEDVPIEAEYVFPLDERSAVYSVEAFVNGKVIMGHVKEKDEAANVYDDAISAGKGAYLFKQERPDVFTMCIGNLPPHKSVILKIAYVAELPTEGDDSLRFTLPLTIASHYSPRVSTNNNNNDVTNAKLFGDIEYENAPYDLEFRADVIMTSSIASVMTASKSNEDSLDITSESPNKYCVKSNKNLIMDTDLTLIVKLNDPHKPVIVREVNHSGTHTSTALALHFWPKIETHDESNAEIIFLMDRSRSMRRNIYQARATMFEILKHLPSTCTFSIPYYSRKTYLLIFINFFIGKFFVIFFS